MPARAFYTINCAMISVNLTGLWSYCSMFMSNSRWVVALHGIMIRNDG